MTAIILWNTRYLEQAVNKLRLRQTEDVPDPMLAHLSPLGWEHVNLTGPAGERYDPALGWSRPIVRALR